MSKRGATSELNHDNWNDEYTPEEAGTFQRGTPEVLEKRVIKCAKRRAVGSSASSSAGVFAGFHGFNKPADNSALFSFLKKDNVQLGSAGQDRIDGEVVNFGSNTPMFKLPGKEVSTGEQDPFQPSPPFTLSYLGAIKKLNECFLKHVQSSFDENQFIILSPCFRDYEKHLKSILPLNDSSGKEEGENKSEEKKENQMQGNQIESSSNAEKDKKPNFSGTANNEGSSSGLKMFSDQGNKTSPSLSTPFVNSSPFASSDKKPFSWAWGASSSPSQVTTSESAKDVPKESAAHEDAEESDAPPKSEFKQVVEEGAVYSRRCKVFVKKENNFQDYGVGMLYLKPVESGKKTQLLVRADTSLGNVLINTLLSSEMNMQRMGNNNVMLICLPTPDYKPPKPLPILLRVKTSSDADELLQKLSEYKK